MITRNEGIPAADLIHQRDPRFIRKHYIAHDRIKGGRPYQGTGTTRRIGCFDGISRPPQKRTEEGTKPLFIVHHKNTIHAVSFALSPTSTVSYPALSRLSSRQFL
jgi:hypothetical protein